MSERSIVDTFAAAEVICELYKPFLELGLTESLSDEALIARGTCRSGILKVEINLNESLFLVSMTRGGHSVFSCVAITFGHYGIVYDFTTGPLVDFTTGPLVNGVERPFLDLAQLEKQLNGKTEDFDILRKWFQDRT